MLLYAALAGGLYTGLCFVLAKSYLSPRRHVPETPVGARDIEFAGSLGQTPAFATPGLASGKPKGEVLFVLAHGYGGSRGAWSQLFPELHGMGYEAVAPAMPGHDRSPFATPGFGGTEAQIILDAVAWARKRFSKPPKVVLVGVSMGGSASWLASANDPDICAVVTEGAFARLDPTIDRWFDLALPAGSKLLKPVRWMATGMSGVDPAKINPVEAAAQWKGKPGLVIHCEQDRLMPKYNADQLSQASGCPMWCIPEAAHAQGLSVASAEFAQRLHVLVQKL